MQNKYCLPIITEKKEKVFEAIEKNQDYDYFEIWLDYISGPDESFLNSLISKYEERLLLLFRRQQLDPIRMSWDERVKILTLINNTKCLLDVDISLQRQELEYMKDNNLGISKLISYHNYEKTPDYLELNGILSEMEEYDPAIVKVATMCRSENDAFRLMDLLIELRHKKKSFIVIGMGEFGKITRVYGLLEGNEFNFAPRLITEKSAPGQIIKEDLEAITKIFNK